MKVKDFESSDTRCVEIGILLCHFCERHNFYDRVIWGAAKRVEKGWEKGGKKARTISRLFLRHPMANMVCTRK